MQRLLSLGTLGVIGWLGLLFLQGGALNGIAVPQGGAQQGGYSGGYRTPGPWQAPPTSGSVGSGVPSTPAQSQRPYQTASAGGHNVGGYSGGNGPVAPPPNLAGGPTIRIASFNIQDFGVTKASKQYVMRELADIIAQFDVIALQEISTQDEFFIPNFVKICNHFSRRQYDHVIGPRVGVTTQTEQYVYLYDTARVELDRHSVYTVNDPDGLLHREPLVATFRTREVDAELAFTFTLVNMHTDPDIVQQEMDVLAEVYRVVRRSSRGEDDIIMLGDFNTDDRNLGRLGELPGMLPLIAGVWTNTRQTKQYDNLIIHAPSTTEYAGRSGVFDFMRFKNLSMSQALQVSDHFPVWAEFSVYERDYAGRVASRRRQYGR